MAKDEPFYLVPRKKPGCMVIIDDMRQHSLAHTHKHTVTARSERAQLHAVD